MLQSSGCIDCVCHSNCSTKTDFTNRRPHAHPQRHPDHTRASSHNAHRASHTHCTPRIANNASHIARTIPRNTQTHITPRNSHCALCRTHLAHPSLRNPRTTPQETQHSPINIQHNLPSCRIRYTTYHNPTQTSTHQASDIIQYYSSDITVNLHRACISKHRTST